MIGETDYERRMSEIKCVELGEKIGYKKGFEEARKQFERPHGKIITDEDGNTSCSECGQTSVFGNFCYNCGADLRGEGEAE